MSVICGAIKDGSVAIACDTQSSFGTLKVSSSYIVNSSKLYTVNGNIIGFCGWSAVSDILEHIIYTKPKKLKFDSRMEIYSTFKKLHSKFIENYYIEPTEDENLPVQSSQLDLIIINKYGLFEIGSLREVNQYNKYWAIGSGQELAIGAMYSVYETENLSAVDIAEIGVKAATEFDDGCNLPLVSESIKLKNTHI